MSTDAQRELEANFATALEPSPAPGTSTLADGVPAKFHGRKRDLETFLWPVDRIRRDPDQVRRRGKSPSEPAIQQLAQSIADVGQLYPISIRWIEQDSTWEVVDGDCRFVAAKEILRWNYIRVTTTDIDDEKVIWRQLHENLHRSDLHPLDLAAALKQLRDQGLSIPEIGRRLKKHKTYVQKALRVADALSAKAAELLERSPQGNSLDVVYEVAKLPDGEQESFAREIVSKGFTRQQLRDAITQAKTRPASQPRTNRGRRAHFREIVQTADATVTVAFRKSVVKKHEVITALKDALQHVLGDKKKES